MVGQVQIEIQVVGRRPLGRGRGCHRDGTGRGSIPGLDLFASRGSGPARDAWRLTDYDWVGILYVVVRKTSQNCIDCAPVTIPHEDQLGLGRLVLRNEQGLCL